MKKVKYLSRETKAYLLNEIHDYSVNIDTREIFLHGYIGSDDTDQGTDWRISNTFIKNMRLLESLSSNTIIIHQHNIGGNWDCGMSIYDSISLSQCPTLFIMWGCAASMGSVIPQAANIRLISPNCDFMIHEGFVDLQDATYKQATSIVNLNKRMRDAMIEIYSNKCCKSKFFDKKTKSEIESFLVNKLDRKEDWWLTAKEAVNYGFADAILGEEDINLIVEKLNGKSNK